MRDRESVNHLDNILQALINDKHSVRSVSLCIVHHSILIVLSLSHANLTLRRIDSTRFCDENKSFSRFFPTGSHVIRFIQFPFLFHR